MKKIILTSTLASLALVAACSQDSEPGTNQTGLRAIGLPDANSDTARIHYIIESCDPADPFRVEADEELEVELLPGSFDEFKNNPLDKDSKHRFSDHFHLLPPGCYDVTAQPVQADGSHSRVCADAWKKGVVVNEGETTEIFMISQCKGSDPGAIDAIVALNHEPNLVDVYFEDSKFVCDEKGAICAKGEDVDLDPLTYEFGPVAGCDFGTQYVNDKGYTCVEIKCEGPAHYDVPVKVYDMAWDGAAEVRIEDWLAAEGYPNESHAQLVVPVYIEKPGVCGCEGKSIDIVFLQDRSGSFYDDVPTVTAQLPAIEAAINGVASVARYGAASFVDKPISPFGGGSDFTYRLDVALSATLAGVYPADILGGGDFPEAQAEGLFQVAKNAADYGFGADFNYVVIMTDATAHFGPECVDTGTPACTGPNNGDDVVDATEDYPTLVQLSSALTDAGLTPVFAVTAGNEAFYEGLGLGKVITLAPDSSNLAELLKEGLDCK